MQFEQLTAGHGSLSAVRTGQGRDLVVLHSLLADRHAFDPVLPALAASHRVTLINLPGFHGSQPTPLALMDAYMAAVEDGFQEFGIGNDVDPDRQRLRRHRRARLRHGASRAHRQAGAQRCRRLLSARGPQAIRDHGGKSRQ